MLRFLKKNYKTIKAFKDCFCGEDGRLTDSGKKVLAYLRDEACAKGELGKDGSSYLYDDMGRFDQNAAVFLMGKRRMFDLITKHLAVDEKEVLNLIALDREESENLMDNLNI